MEEIESVQNITESLRDLLDNSYNQVKCFGSSTVLLYFLVKDTLHVIYMGDSGLVVCRPKDNSYKVIFRTVE